MYDKTPEHIRIVCIYSCIMKNFYNLVMSHFVLSSASLFELLHGSLTAVWQNLLCFDSLLPAGLSCLRSYAVDTASFMWMHSCIGLEILGWLGEFITSQVRDNEKISWVCWTCFVVQCLWSPSSQSLKANKNKQNVLIEKVKVKTWEKMKKWVDCRRSNQCLWMPLWVRWAGNMYSQWTWRPQSQYTTAVAKPGVWTLMEQTVFVPAYWKHTRENSVGLTL